MIKEKQHANENKSKKGLYQKDISMRKRRKTSKPSGWSKTKEIGLLNIDRMLKLASVKSGKDEISYDGDKVSLTQLGHLPLDIQLQIANNDDITVRKAQTNLKLTSFRNRNRKQKIMAEMIEIEDNRADDSDTQIDVNSNNAYPHSEEDNVDKDESTSSDIQTLHDWFVQNPDPLHEEITKLQDFICICMSEMRLDDAVKFLRLSKRKSCSWTGNQYKRLLSGCNDYLFRTQDKRLDLDWLGL